MGATHVAARITNPADQEECWETLFLVDTGAIDSLAPKCRLEAIGLKPKGSRVCEPADESELKVDGTTADIELMGEIVEGTVIMGADNVEPLLDVTALKSVGIEVDPVSQRLKRIPAVRLKGLA